MPAAHPTVLGHLQQRRLQQILWTLLVVFGLLIVMNLGFGRYRSAGLEGYRKFNRPFWRVWRVGSGRASAALGTDRAQIGGSCVGFRHRGATQRLSA